MGEAQRGREEAGRQGGADWSIRSLCVQEWVFSRVGGIDSRGDWCVNRVRAVDKCVGDSGDMEIGLLVICGLI